MSSSSPSVLPNLAKPTKEEKKPIKPKAILY